MTHLPFTDERVTPFAQLLADALRYSGFEIPPWDEMFDHDRFTLRRQAAFILLRQDEARSTPREVIPEIVPATNRHPVGPPRRVPEPHRPVRLDDGTPVVLSLRDRLKERRLSEITGS